MFKEDISVQKKEHRQHSEEFGSLTEPRGADGIDISHPGQGTLGAM